MCYRLRCARVVLCFLSPSVYEVDVGSGATLRTLFEFVAG